MPARATVRETTAGRGAAAGNGTFERLDAGALAVRATPTPGPRVVAVGVNDPAHGWVEVRAEGPSGQVTASLHAATAEAHAALHAQLSGMAQYLAEREIGVRTLEVNGGAPGLVPGSGDQRGGQAADSGTSPGQNSASGRGAEPDDRADAGGERNSPASWADRAPPSGLGASFSGGGESRATPHLISIRV